MRIYQCSICGEYYFESEHGPLKEDYVCTNCGASYQSFVDITDEYNNRNKN
jgi:rubredoxin|tara:strand:+ start:970 stop:1122 length:153 start_codon:yes stop_codon:yes gene_type:complete